MSSPYREPRRGFRTLGGTVARRLAMLAESTPAIADANITWVTN